MADERTTSQRPLRTPKIGDSDPTNPGPPSPNNVAWQALRATQQVGIPLTEPLVDNTPLGSFWIRKGVYIGTGATNIGIQLPRNPSAFIVVDNTTGGVVYRTAADVAASGPSVLVCRATLGVSVSLLVG